MKIPIHRLALQASMLAAAVFVSGCVYIDAEPDWSNRERVPLAPFDTLVLDGSFGDVWVEVCRDCQAAVLMEERPSQPIRTGSTMAIRSGDAISRDSTEIKLITPDLEAVIINGTGDVVVDGVFTREFQAVNNGSGSIEASGDARTVVAISNGSGSIDTARLQAKEVVVSMTGSGSADVCAFQRIYGALTGSGSLHYACGPDIVDVAATGSGRVSKL